MRDHRLLRNEATSYNTPDLGVGKSIRNLPQLRRVMRGINDRYLAIQQDVLETYIDRGQLAGLREPTITPSGRRTPGLKLDDPRLLAVMQALTCFTHVAHGGQFRTRDMHARAAEALGLTTATYRLGQLRYDLAKLRAKGLVVKVRKTQTYRLTPQNLRICVLFLKLFHRVYAPFSRPSCSHSPTMRSSPRPVAVPWTSSTSTSTTPSTSYSTTSASAALPNTSTGSPSTSGIPQTRISVTHSAA